MITYIPRKKSDKTENSGESNSKTNETLKKTQQFELLSTESS